MTQLLGREFNNEIGAGVKEVVRSTYKMIASEMVDEKKLVFGQIELPRPERVLAVLDLAARGVLAQIAIFDPQSHATLIRQFERDVEAMTEKGMPLTPLGLNVFQQTRGGV